MGKWWEEEIMGKIFTGSLIFREFNRGEENPESGGNTGFLSRSIKEGKFETFVLLPYFGQFQYSVFSKYSNLEMEKKARLGMKSR